MRHRTVHPPSLIALTAAAVVMVAACSSGGDDAATSPPSAEAPSSTNSVAIAATEPTQTTAPPTTAPPTTTAAPTTTVEAVDIGEVGGFEGAEPVVLPPGRYTVGILEPYVFDIDEELQIHAALADYVLVRDPTWSPEERAASVLFLELNGLVPPELAADESVRNVIGPAQPDQVLPLPVDFPAWIEAVPNVSVQR